MDLKVVSNNIKEIVEELFLSSIRKRDKFRLLRYAYNTKHVELGSVVKDTAIDLVLDVGGNEGQFAESIRHLGYKGRIISFEPIAEVFSILSKKAKADGSWRAFEYALGAENTTRTFNVYGDTKLSSFLEGDGSQTARFRNNFDSSKKVTVDIKRLDEVWTDVVAQWSSKKIFLKLDTQGYDLEAFRGVGRHKEQIKYILTEMSVIPLYKNIPSYTAALDFFSREGYGPVSLIPVTRNHNDGRVIEFDCLLRKID